MLSLSLIAAIGAQNIFVLKSGIAQNHILAIVSVCVASDVLLMGLGIFGVADFFAKTPLFALALCLFGIAFVLWYGIVALISAYKIQSLAKIPLDSKRTSLKVALLQTLAITFLNPHVYLDTVVIIGAVSLTLDSTQKAFFALGSMSASFVWFFGLGLFARRVRKYFTSAKTWVMLDLITAFVMFAVALNLAGFVLEQSGVIKELW